MDRSIESLLNLCREKGMGHHAFLRKMSGQPVDHGMLYDFLANLAVTTSAYTGWVTSLMPRLDNLKVRSILFKLLNDEYGNGDPDQVHVDLFKQSLELLQKYKTVHGEAELKPGTEFRDRTAKIFDAQNPYEGLGVVMAGEIFADQMIRWLGEELSRQDKVKTSDITWYTAHAEVEADHALDSGRLGKLISESEVNREAAWRGAERAIESQTRFLNELLARHFPGVAAAA